MEVGLMDIVRYVNRSWIYDRVVDPESGGTWKLRTLSSAYREFFIRGKKPGGEMAGGKCPDTNFHQYFLPIFFIFLFLPHLHVTMLTYSKFKYIINYCSFIDV